MSQPPVKDEAATFRRLLHEVTPADHEWEEDVGGLDPTSATYTARTPHLRCAYQSTTGEFTHVAVLEFSEVHSGALIAQFKSNELPPAHQQALYNIVAAVRQQVADRKVAAVLTYLAEVKKENK